ncbi:MAG: glutamate--cysteine ligase [Candidatus Omnitrophica bacterium]|nr:glutamate--cysteine ligase [Candidatus Omnitrophota bacterium]
MSPSKTPYHLFEVFGIEIEYMIVNRDTLEVSPVADEILKQADGGTYTCDHVEDGMGWANELVCHLLEIRNDTPVPSLEGMGKRFHDSVLKLSKLAAERNAQLMPSSAHPWMNPVSETRIWPHEYSEVYNQFDRIFNCRRHGWANLQSCQLNLPFCGDEEFGRLHAAIRLLLPIMPALASSSPILESRLYGRLNNRLAVYRTNAEKVPSVAGRCIPEAVFSLNEYHEKILQKIYADIRPLDPEGTLQEEWLNARGAIARFDRDAIEIRVLDSQECPDADIAICKTVAGVLKAMAEENFCSFQHQKQWAIDPLEEILKSCIVSGELTEIRNRDYLALFGIKKETCTAGDLWRHLLTASFPARSENDRRDLEIVREILNHGVLSRRIIQAVGYNFQRENLRRVYRELSECLIKNKFFEGLRVET